MSTTIEPSCVRTARITLSGGNGCGLGYIRLFLRVISFDFDRGSDLALNSARLAGCVYRILFGPGARRLEGAAGAVLVRA
jgi:hypothetical protein